MMNVGQTSATVVQTVWQYEYLGNGGPYWVTESSRDRAVERAGYRTGTGRIRSKEEIITTISSPWTEETVEKAVIK